MATIFGIKTMHVLLIHARANTVTSLILKTPTGRYGDIKSNAWSVT